MKICNIFLFFFFEMRANLFDRIRLKKANADDLHFPLKEIID